MGRLGLRRIGRNASQDPWVKLREMERKGEVELGTGELPPEFWTMRRGQDPKAMVREALREERDEGR